MDSFGSIKTTHSDKIGEVVKFFEEFNLILQEHVTDNTKLENAINMGHELLNSINEDNPNLILSNNLIRTHLEKVSSWILKNFSSGKLNGLVIFISALFLKLGYRAEVKKEEITKILQLETYEQVISVDKKEKKNFDEILSKDSIISNPFLSAFYALIVTIANKPEIIIKSKHLLKNVLTVLTQICEIDNISIYYKKKRLISVFCKIMKELQKAKDTKDSLQVIVKLLMNLFARIAMKRPIYRDYMFKKAIPDKITDIFNIFYSKDYEMVKSFCIYCFFSVRISDHKTFYWTKGIVNNLLEILILENKKENNDENLIEYITLSLNHLANDNVNIQMELKDLNFLEIAKEILVKYSKNNFIIFNIVSTLRRIKDEEYTERLTEELLCTFFALFDYFYINIKKEIENDNNKIAEISSKFDFIIIKELVAILGNIVKEESHSKPFIDKNLHLVLIDLKLSFFSFPKLIKNTIGALINLTTSNEIRENISSVAAFIKSIYITLDKYKDNQAIIDYELKLIINVIKNDLTVKTFISGDMFFYLLLFLKNFPTHDDIMFNSVKIIRTLILKSKTIYNCREGI